MSIRWPTCRSRRTCDLLGERSARTVHLLAPPASLRYGPAGEKLIGLQRCKLIDLCSLGSSATASTSIAVTDRFSRTVANALAVVGDYSSLLVLQGDYSSLLALQEVFFGVLASTGSRRTRDQSERTDRPAEQARRARRPVRGAVRGPATPLRVHTDAGRDLQPVLLALRGWGDRHAPQGELPTERHHDCGAVLHPWTACDT
jgi:hypothetical protein